MAENDRLGSETDLRHTALAGGRWGLIESISVQVLSLVTTAILARLLVPDDYGIVATVHIIVALFRLLTEMGFGAAIVSRKTAAEPVLSTTFWASIGVGATGTAVALIVVEPITRAFGTPDAAPYLALASTTLLLGLTGSVPRSLLRRDLRFGVISGISIASSLSHAVLAVGLAAVADIGAWALIVGNVAATGVQTFLAFVASRWHPRLTFSWPVLMKDMRFNAGYLASGGLTYFSKNGDYWGLGRWGDSALLGVYYIAYTLPNLVRKRLTNVVQSVLFPVFSRVEDRERLRSGYLSGLQFIALLAWPALVGLAVLSSEVIPIVFGSQWTAAITPMTILAIAAALSSLRPLGVTVLLAERRPGLNAVVTLAQLIVLGIGLALASQAGTLAAVSFAVLASSLVSAAFNQVVVLRILSCAVRRLLRTLAPPIVSVALMAVAVMATKQFVMEVEWSLLGRTALLVITGVVTYLIVGFGLFRRAFVKLFHDLRFVLFPKRRGERDQATPSSG